jgi:hypothetical protein
MLMVLLIVLVASAAFAVILDTVKRLVYRRLPLI